MNDSIAGIYKGSRNKKSKDAMPTEDKQKYGEFAYILRQEYRRTKMYGNLGKITYGDCVEYSAYPTAVLAAANVITKEDTLYKIPASLLITKTVQHLVPYIESLIPISIGKKMWESLN